MWRAAPREPPGEPQPRAQARWLLLPAGRSDAAVWGHVLTPVLGTSGREQSALTQGWPCFGPRQLAPLEKGLLFVPHGNSRRVETCPRRQALPSRSKQGAARRLPCFFGALDSLSSSFPGFCFEDLVLLPELACPESHQEAWAGDVDLEISEY